MDPTGNESPPKNAVSGRGPMVHTTAYEAQDPGFFLAIPRV